MDLSELLQISPAKADEIFAKLFGAPSGALKVRERLFNELKTELELYAYLVERRLFPVLRKHQATKGLVADANSGNKALRAKLAELDALPRGDEAFIPKLQELKNGFRQYVRDGKKELLPAVLRAVSEEQAAERKVAEQQAAERARKAADKQAAERKAQRLAAHKAAAHKAAEQMAAQRAQVAADRQAAEPRARDNARNPGPDFRTLAAFSLATTRGMTEMGSAWMEWMGGSNSVGTQTLRRLLRCRTMQELAETQRSFLADSTQSWMEHNARVLQISRRVADDGLRGEGGRAQNDPGAA